MRRMPLWRILSLRSVLSSKFCTKESLIKTIESKRTVIETCAYNLLSKGFKESFLAQQITIKI
jgi:hypothetical protein